MQLPEAAKEFDKLDKTWLKIMTDTAKNTNAHDACLAEGRVGILTEMSSALDKCQKSLTDYLETKRNAFPRFFFISDDELLSVLGTSDVTSIQEHMLKLFDNCAELIFARNNRVVKGMVSSEGESFEFRTVGAHPPMHLHAYANTRTCIKSFVCGLASAFCTSLLHTRVYACVRACACIHFLPHRICASQLSYTHAQFLTCPHNQTNRLCLSRARWSPG